MKRSRREYLTYHGAALVLLSATRGNVAGDAKVNNHEVFGGESVRVEAADDDEAATKVDVMAGFVKMRAESREGKILAGYFVAVKALV